MRTFIKYFLLIIGIIFVSVAIVGLAYLRGRNGMATCARVTGELEVTRVIFHNGKTAIATDAERILACRSVKGVLEPIDVIMGDVRGTAVISGIPATGDPITVLDPLSKKSAIIEIVKYNRDDLAKMKDIPKRADGPVRQAQPKSGP